MADTPEAFTIHIDAFVKKAKGRAEEFCSEFAQDIAEEVVRGTPYKTGFLRASWHAALGAMPAMTKQSPDPSGVQTVARLGLVSAQFSPGEVIYYSNGAAYARFVHDGTSKMRARPWVSEVVLRSNLIAQKTARRVGAEP